MPKFFIDLLNNKVLMSAACSWALAQIIKTIIHLIVTRKFVAERLVGSGGMPSCHSACVTALATSIFITQGGITSPMFALAFIFAIVVMYDAMGVRRETGNQAKLLNEMMEIFEKMGNDVQYEDKLKEFVGHTPFQVSMGALLGLVFAILYCLVFTK